MTSDLITLNDLNATRRVAKRWAKLTLQIDNVKGFIYVGSYGNGTVADALDHALDIATNGDLIDDLIIGQTDPEKARIKAFAKFDASNTDKIFVEDIRYRTIINATTKGITLQVGHDDTIQTDVFIEKDAGETETDLARSFAELVTNVEFFGQSPVETN